MTSSFFLNAHAALRAVLELLESLLQGPVIVFVVVTLIQLSASPIDPVKQFRAPSQQFDATINGIRSGSEYASLDLLLDKQLVFRGDIDGHAGLRQNGWNNVYPNAIDCIYFQRACMLLSPLSRRSGRIEICTWKDGHRGVFVNFLRIIWDDGPDGNVEHIDQHDLTPADVEFVLRHAREEETSDSSGRPCVFGYTPDEEYILVVFEWIDEDTVLPVTAYEVPEP
jgi:uncharacterized DUF497 family protein